MLEAALERAWPAVGFSDHAPVEGESWCMPHSRLDDYFATLGDLRRLYADRIEIAIGLELDWRETAALEIDPRLDYWIGSFHFFEQDGRRFAIDGNLDMVKEALAVAASGDGRRFCQRYWQGLGELVERHRPPVIGHLDLLKKQNSFLGLFDPQAAWYRDMVEAVLALAGQSASIIEVNTGGMARGYLNEPYPSWAILRRVRELGLPIQLNSDCHQTQTIDFAYAEVSEGLRDLGFKSQRVFRNGAWRDQAL
jgi:histidinol-phosphatase (PHP family)